jgi:hypothetical protein
LAAVEADIWWLLGFSKEFEFVHSVQEFFAMAASVPKLCMRAIVKACRSREARITAIALLPIGGRDSTAVAAIVDQPTFMVCSVCQYVASSGRELNMHMVTDHGAITDVQQCVDDFPACTICGLWLNGRVRVLAHILDKSPICKHNILLRGAFVPLDVGITFRESDQASKKLCVNAALQPKYAHKRCVRTFGHHLEIVDLAGNVVVSDNSRPIGPSGGNKKWLPAQLTEKDTYVVPAGMCMGSRYMQCTVACV